jgi:hypothetical protein
MKKNSKLIKEELVSKNSLKEKIKQIKEENPGKFDHLPDPILGAPLRKWTESEIENFIKKLKFKLENN